MMYLVESGADQSIYDCRRRLALHASTYDHRIRCMALLVQSIDPILIDSRDDEVHSCIQTHPLVTSFIAICKPAVTTLAFATV